MKFSRKIAIGAAAVLGLAAAAVIAQPGQTRGAMGMHGAMGGMQHAPMGGMEQGPMGGQQLMTPEERSALHEKMRNAKTLEERHAIAESAHAEMRKRATERGAAPKVPAETERSN